MDAKASGLQLIASQALERESLSKTQQTSWPVAARFDFLAEVQFIIHSG